MTGGKVRQYPYFVRLFHTSAPLRSVELSKEWQGVSACGKSVTLSLLCQTFPHFHTSEKCGTKDEKRKYGSCGQHWTFVDDSFRCRTEYRILIWTCEEIYFQWSEELKLQRTDCIIHNLWQSHPGGRGVRGFSWRRLCMHAFVVNWLRGKRLNKLCALFEGI